MNEEVTIPFQEIVSVDSIDNLVELYIKRGSRFVDEKSFLNVLSKNWKKELERLKRESQYSKDSSEFPSIDVIVEGVTYGIYGVVHDKRVLGRKYIELVSRALERYPNWISEDCISDAIQVEDTAIELPDFSANTLWTELKHCIPIGLSFPRGLVQAAYDELFNKSIVIQNYLSELNIPLEARGRLPAYVEIELREKHGKPYTHEQARSAYHAEFLKAWKKGENKGDFIGQYHAAEIKFFLNNGVKDNRIVDLANSHAELLERDPASFNTLKNKIDTKYNIAQGAGVIVGGFPYIAIGTMLLLALNNSIVDLICPKPNYR